MYVNVMVTIIAGLVVFNFLYGIIFSRFFNKASKHLLKYTGKSPEYYDKAGQIHASFNKGDFQQFLKICEEILEGQPFEDAVLSCKAYSLYHLKRYAEAKEVFELLNTLPNQDCSNMIKKIDAIES